MWRKKREEKKRTRKFRQESLNQKKDSSTKMERTSEKLSQLE
jgi:hypothetical protein